MLLMALPMLKLPSTKTRKMIRPTDTSGPECDLCGRGMGLWRLVPGDGKRGTPNAFSDVYWCNRCEYGRVHPLPAADEVADFYRLDRYYTQGESHFADAGRVGWFDRLRVHLAWRMDRGEPLSTERIHAALPAKSRVCDIGCGSGALALALAELGHEVTGVEVDAAALAKGHQDKFEFHAGTGERIPDALKGRTFDAIVLSHVLEHCIHPSVTLENVRRLLVPGGLFVCEVPNNAAVACERRGAAWEMFDAPRHLHFFTHSSLSALCERAHLRPERAFHGGFTREFSNEWINTERYLWTNVYQYASKPSSVPYSQNSRLRAWALLAETALANPDLKYDSVGLFARAA
jgi:2-polyprenyl-3-methyl-5-hydroxy-6-metoxy-1,4-benzoquinol methylase